MIRPSERHHEQTTVNQAAQSKRPTTALPEKLEKRLMGYALAAGAAGVGVLALTPPAQASTIVAQHSSNLQTTMQVGCLRFLVLLTVRWSGPEGP